MFLVSCETNIVFEPDGIRIINMDKSHTILAYLYLAAQNFEFYEFFIKQIHHQLIDL